MKLTARSFLLLGSLGLSLLAAGAALAAPPLEHAPAAPATNPAPNPRNVQRAAPQAHGLVQIAGEALADVTLRPDQREAIQKLGATVETAQISVDKAENALLLALAEQLASGHIDRKALEPQITAFAEARQSASPVLHRGFDGLHAQLDPEQRAKFVDSMERRVKQFVEAEASTARFDEWAKLIGLSDEQKQHISAELAKLKPAVNEEQEKVKQAFDAFRGDSFSMEKFLSERDAGSRATEKANRVVQMTEVVAGILTPEQRDKAAARLRDVAGGVSTKKEMALKSSDDAADGDDNIGSASEEIWAARGGYARGGAVGVGAVGVRSAGYGYARGVGYPGTAGLGIGW